MPERWWEAFNDPTLDALEARAVTANLDLKTAALRFAQSRAQRRIAGAGRAPQIDGSAAAARQRQSEIGAATRMIEALASPADRDAIVEVLSEPFNVYQAGFDARWELDLWGRVRRSIEAADADVAAARAAFDGVTLGIHAEAARAYFELRGWQRQLRLARLDVAAAGEHQQLMQARADGGMISDLDATQERAQLAGLRARLPGLEAEQAQALNQLSLLLGEHPGALRAELEAHEETAAPTLPDLAPGLPSELARRRPDIREAEAKLHAATATTGIAVAALYPRITLSGNFGFESLASDGLDDWGGRRWSIGPSLDIPLFDGGRRRGIVTLRKLQQQQAAVTYQQTVLAAWHEIDTALTGYSAERLRHRELVERVAASRDALAWAQVRYEKGQADFLDELLAERAMLAAQRELSDSETALAIRLVVIYKALGGGVPAASRADP